jgi:phosphocarrier protein FPr
LGERGLRLCLARPELFREQLRAILRAAAYGSLRIMFPMVADVSEWRAARDLVEELRAGLNVPRVELGIMIEIPSAALMADAFAPEVDFFSIGTNDLTQYTLAMDRMHPSLAGKSDGLHPAVLRLIAATVTAAHKAGKWVGVCGELASDPLAVPILIGLGVDELSVSVPAIPVVKAQIRSLKLSQSQSLAQRALHCATAQEVRAL